MAKILVVEDENDIRSNLRRFLQLEGHDVVEAENGRLGVEAAIGHLPDLIICDLMMPELDGFSVLREIRGNPLTKHIAFCFLTASAEKDTRIKGLAHGADEYITKPFDLAGLREALMRMLATLRNPG
jgi:CheY-like chemotaxis protein